MFLWIFGSITFDFVPAELTAAHFGGGGLLRRKAISQQEEEEPEKPRTRKELIEELIAKSKIEKVCIGVDVALKRYSHLLM